MKVIKSKAFKVVSAILMVVILLILIVPLFIPINGEVGLREPEEFLGEGNGIVTVPFDGTDGIDLFYEFELNEATDKNFILLHGSLYNSKSWSEVITYFSSIGNVYAYDQIPYGYSEKILEGEWTKENPYTTDAAIDQLEQFMNQLGIEKATLVGNSFGGVLATEAAYLFDDRVESLILVDPAILVSESMPAWLVESPQAEHLGPMLASGLSKGNQFYESTFYNKEFLSDERLRYSKRETEINNWNLAMWEYLQAWSVTPSDIGDYLGDIDQPVLVISGEYDEIVPLSDRQEISRLLPNSSLVVIPDCGHMPHEEKPVEFIEVVDKWINSN